MNQEFSDRTTGLLQSAKRLLEGADQSLMLLGHFVGHIDALVDGVGSDTRRIKSDAQALAQALSDRFTLAKRGVQASPKALKVAKVLLGIALKYRIEAGRAAAAGASERSEERLTALHESSANTLRELCIEARGTFLKLGQFLSMRPDLLPAPYIRQLATLRNQVPALPFALIREVVEADLSAPLESLFTRVDEEPRAQPGHDQRDEGKDRHHDLSKPEDEGLQALNHPVTLQLYAIELEIDHLRYDAALKRLDQIASRSVRKETWLIRRGEILEKARRPEQAKQAYQGALDAIDALPQSRIRNRAVERLQTQATAGLERLDADASAKEPGTS